MIKVKLFVLFVMVKNLFCPCHKDVANSGFEKAEGRVRIEKCGKMDPLINESSGLTVADTAKHFWTMNDSGGKPEIYKIDAKGKLLTTLPIPNAMNRDWEEITSDSIGNIYIGDFGNNYNNRRDLTIYKYSPVTNTTDIILFSYPDQHQFPPQKAEANFDCEAFFWYSDSLYLISKNRGNPIVHIYCLPSKAGNYVATLKQKLYVNAMVTGAAVNTSTRECALITYGKLYFLRIQAGSSTFLQPVVCRKFARSGQAEAIAYLNDKMLVVSNEAGKIFRVRKYK